MLGPCPLCKKKQPSKDLEKCCFLLRLRWTMMVLKLTTLSKSSRNSHYYIDKENKCHRLGTQHLSWCIYLEVVDMCTNRSSFQNKTPKLETDPLFIGLSTCSLVQSLYPSNKWEVHWAKYVLNRATSQRLKWRWKILKTQLNPFLRNNMNSYCTTSDLCHLNMLKEVLSDHLFWSWLWLDTLQGLKCTILPRFTMKKDIHSWE